jgi:hypothetical protein
MEITGRYLPAQRAAGTGSARITRALLACGVVSGPFFLLLAFAQMPIRPGFDIRHLAISTLSLGDLGWIQVANFAITGLLVAACAAGMRSALRRRLGGTWAPILIGTYALALLSAAVFRPDPGMGFPPGAPAGMPATMSGHATVHMVAFVTAFASIIAACFVLRRLYASAGTRGWAAYCVVTGITAPILVVIGMNIPSWVGVIFAIAAAVAFGWVSAVAAQLRAGLE